MKICIISEGAYPIVRGGVSEWTHQLIKELHSVEFDVYCIAPPGITKSLYDKPSNLKRIIISDLGSPNRRSKKPSLPKSDYDRVLEYLSGVLSGKPIDCEPLNEVTGRYTIPIALLGSKQYWDFLVKLYRKNCPERNFSEFFWTVHGVFSSLLDLISLVDELPEADIYHSLTCGLGGLVGSLVNLKYKGHLLISEHGAYLKEREIDLSRQVISPESHNQLIKFYQSVVRTSYQNADYLMPITTKYIINEVQFGAAPEKIKVTPVGIKTDYFVPQNSLANPRNGKTPLIGCFGRVVPVKDQINLIRAAQKVLGSANANFVFIGEIQDDEYYLECQDLVNDLELTDNVKFVGHVENVLEWYHRTDIFVLSSKSEGVPLALLEAMSCGLPCVCTGVGGIPDIIQDRSMGYLVPPNDSDTLASKIIELIKNKELRIQMGEHAREVVKREYTVQRMADHILAVYLQAIKQEVAPNGRAVR
ncbi:MAG TPA: GT4 family glycosyltransferase PelF [Dehalococcoidales bacterium]|nr:GT4 family glycosyltransferase PelF [Dehalococcoidales bacterium]